MNWWIIAAIVLIAAVTAYGYIRKPRLPKHVTVQVTYVRFGQMQEEGEHIFTVYKDRKTQLLPYIPETGDVRIIAAPANIRIRMRALDRGYFRITEPQPVLYAIQNQGASFPFLPAAPLTPQQIRQLPHTILRMAYPYHAFDFIVRLPEGDGVKKVRCRFH